MVVAPLGRVTSTYADFGIRPSPLLFRFELVADVEEILFFSLSMLQANTQSYTERSVDKEPGLEFMVVTHIKVSQGMKQYQVSGLRS